MSPVTLLAEGPHGPGGRITGDPGGPKRFLIMAGVSGAIVWLSIRQLIKLKQHN